MKRYYICPVGLYLDAQGDPYYAAKISQYPGFHYVAEIPNNPDGTPKNGWALCHISGKDFSAIEADPEFELVSNDGPTNDEIDISLKMDSSLKAKGITVSQKVRKNELVRAIGKGLSLNFHEDTFKIGD